MNRRLVCWWLVGLAVALPMSPIGCHDKSDENAEPRTSVTAEATSFHDRLLQIATSYEEYGRFGTEPRWSPLYCAAPPPVASKAPPPRPRVSASGDSRTHGRKLYWLFVRAVPPSVAVTGSYIRAGKPNPVGQVVVKEAWQPEEVDAATPQRPVVRKARVRRGDAVEEHEDSFVPYVRRGDRLYHAASKSALFILYKLDPRTPATDEGWVYGTVTPGGKRVTAAGRVESCMGCHRDAPHDRLFGLPEQ